MPDMKHNATASTEPGPSDDSSQGYSIRSTWFNGTTGEVWYCTDATAGAAVWINPNFDPVPWPSQYFRASDHILSVSDGQVAADLLTMQPFTIQRKRRISGIAIRLTTAQAGGEIRLGVYRTDWVTEKPASRKHDAGVISLASGSGDKVITVDWYFDPGVYWLAALNKGGGTLPTLRRIGSVALGRVLGPNGDDVGFNPNRYLSVARNYADGLPTTAPAMTTVSGGSDCPVIMLRRA